MVGKSLVDIVHLRDTDRLLVRTIEGAAFFRMPGSREIVSYMPQLEAEIVKMRTANGMSDVSTTLLPHRCATGLYSAGGKTLGILLNAGKVNIQGIAPNDVNSNTDQRGVLQGTANSMASLEELAEHCRRRNSREVNEVNIANCTIDACVGVLSVGSPQSTVDAALAQHKILTATGKLVPICGYDAQNGKIHTLSEDNIKDAFIRFSRLGLEPECVETTRLLLHEREVAVLAETISIHVLDHNAFHPTNLGYTSPTAGSSQASRAKPKGKQ